MSGRPDPGGVAAAVAADADAIARAVEVLGAGGLLGLPTETVYGLAADASNPAAIARMFAAKGRPADHPVIVHLASAAQLDDWARDIPDVARRLAAAFWPGPLTLILKRAPHVLNAVTGGQDTVGLRVPSHPVAHAVLAAFGGGVAAPSANKFGRVSATTAAHVREEFGAAVDLVLDGGASQVGIESTIVACDLGGVRVLRPGRITRDMLATVADFDDRGSTAVPRVSGSLEKHYAPRHRVAMLPASELAQAIACHAGNVAVLSRKRPAGKNLRHWAAAIDAEGFAHSLYATLREMDCAGCDLLLVETPPVGAAWEAVHDRLRRAVAGSGAASDEAR
ncbi:MAG: threonylcarbamoyl-AMP synthase [Burkholderiales bacterium]|nr:threonylcarbamoyl-AMP synthase [Burkholderiales bacterium]